MEHNAQAIKAGIAALLAFGTALWGWFGWLALGWVALMIIDYLSGSIAAAKNHEWSSEDARKGIRGKGGMILVVLCAGALDLILGLIVDGAAGIVLPAGWSYSVLVCPLVVVWYIITEIGSILENAVKMGATLPGWLQKLVEGMKVAVTKAGDKMVAGSTENKAAEGGGKDNSA